MSDVLAALTTARAQAVSAGRRYPPIPEPDASPESLRQTVRLLRKAVLQLIDNANAASLPIGIGFDFGEPVVANSRLAYVAVFPLLIPVNFDGSQGNVLVADATDRVFSFAKNNLPIGSVTVLASGQIVWSIARPAQIDIGDVLTMTAPGAVGALSGAVFTVLANRV